MNKWRVFSDRMTLIHGRDTSRQIESQLARHNLNYFGITVHNGVKLDISILCEANILRPMEDILRDIHGR